jgi:hypothetical protein
MNVEGLDKLKTLIRTLKTLPKEVLKSADSAMVNNSSDLLDMNRKQLQGSGTDSEGKRLEYQHPRVSKVAGSYTTNYNRFKRKQGGNTSFVDLTLSGNFLNSLRLDHARLGVFKIYAETSGFDLQRELEWNYGKDIFGLQDANLQKFADQNMKPYIEFEIEQLISKI